MGLDGTAIVCYVRNNIQSFVLDIYLGTRMMHRQAGSVGLVQAPHEDALLLDILISVEHDG